MTTLNRDTYSKMSSDNLRSRFLSAEDRSRRAPTSEAYLSDAFAMQEIWTVLEARGEPHPFIKQVRAA